MPSSLQRPAALGTQPPSLTRAPDQVPTDEVWLYRAAGSLERLSSSAMPSPTMLRLEEIEAPQTTLEEREDRRPDGGGGEAAGRGKSKQQHAQRSRGASRGDEGRASVRAR